MAAGVGVCPLLSQYTQQGHLKGGVTVRSTDGAGVQGFVGSNISGGGLGGGRGMGAGGGCLSGGADPLGDVMVGGVIIELWLFEPGGREWVVSVEYTGNGDTS